MTRRRVLLCVRVALVAVGFVGALTAPPWVPLAAIVLLALRFEAWEAVLLGLFADLAWLPGHVSMHHFPLMTLAAILVVWGCAPIRRELLERGPALSRPTWY